MTVYDLAKKLSEMYENAGDGEKTTMIHLFGIRYAEIIKDKKYSAADILGKTKLRNGKCMSNTYTTEIYKGIRLSRYVVEKQTEKNM